MGVAREIELRAGGKGHVGKRGRSTPQSQKKTHPPPVRRETKQIQLKFREIKLNKHRS